MSLTDSEFAALRQTIASRGTVRVVLLPLTIFGWALLTARAGFGADGSLEALLSLSILAAGFEAIHALHVGVERIGRYIQVFYENGTDGPRWETTAMAVGPALPGGGVDPLFTVIFALATLVNAILSLMRASTGPGAIVVLAFHAALLVRLARARAAAARQRAVELESYRAIKTRQ